MNVTIFSQMAYEYKDNWTLGENKPNQTQLQMQSFLEQKMRFVTLKKQLCNGAPESPLANKTKVSDKLYRKAIK